ncbi:MAG: aminoacyl-tRNA hydrolase [Acidimicrobiales bacterium]
MLRRRTGAAADLLAVGLGNPGAEYERTRHNVGAEVAARLAARHGSRLKASRGSRALSAEVRVGGRLLAVAFPQTYMNDSGMAVASLLRRHGVEDLGRLVVVHDEMDLPVGRVKVKVGGGTAGHNGLRSIQAHVHGGAFLRVRIGIGRPPGREDGVGYVLSAPRKAERAELDVAVEEAADAVEVILAEGGDVAMNRYNPPGP